MQRNNKIISGLFSDKFILELHLSSKSFEVDRLLLVEELGEFYDNPAPIHVWIQNSNLSEKIINIAKKALSGLQHGTFHSPIPYELQNKAIYLDTFLPIYWVNLSILLAKLVESINGRFTKRSDFINIAVESIVNTIKYANYILVGYLYEIMYSSTADEAGFPDVGNLLRAYEGYHKVSLDNNEERLIRTFFSLGMDNEIILVDLLGNRDNNVAYSRCYLWDLNYFDMDELRRKIAPSQIIFDYARYVECIPQILGRHLQYISFNEGKGINELQYQIAIGIDEYHKMGLA